MDAVGFQVVNPLSAGVRRTNRATCVCSSVGSRIMLGIGGAAVGAALMISAPGYALIEAPRCDGGVGPGCESAAEGNDFIKQLQKKTAEKKEERERELLEDYWMRNYGDFFKVGGKELVKNDDGSWALKAIETPESRAMKAIFGKNVEE